MDRRLGDPMGRTRQESVRIEHRRTQVSELHLQHWKQTAIARELGVSQSTVSRTLRSRPRRPIQSWITFLRNQLGATATTGYEEGWTLVRDRGSFSQRRPHVIFRNRKTVSDERSRPATARCRICPPFQNQPGLIYPLPGHARSPPCIPPLSMNPQQNVSPPSYLTGRSPRFSLVPRQWSRQSIGKHLI